METNDKIKEYLKTHKHLIGQHRQDFHGNRASASHERFYKISDSFTFNRGSAGYDIKLKLNAASNYMRPGSVASSGKGRLLRAPYRDGALRAKAGAESLLTSLLKGPKNPDAKKVVEMISALGGKVSKDGDNYTIHFDWLK